MLQVTKIFSFEMAHAIHKYEGACKNIHGHSYELHVGIAAAHKNEDFIPAPGFIVDFKEIKKLVTEVIIEPLDHKLLLSHSFVAENKVPAKTENLVLWNFEPTVENILIYIKQTLCKLLPAQLTLVHLKLYETKNAFAEWSNTNY